MRRLCLVAILVWVFIAESISQQENNFRGNVYYLEVLGNFHGLSVNWEKSLKSDGYLKIYSRLGLGIWPYLDEDLRLRTERLGIPFGLVFFIGNKNSHLELSTLLTHYFRYNSFPDNETPNRFWMFVPGIGYRFQKPGSSFYFRYSYTPTFRLTTWEDYNFKSRPFNSAGGISVGYFLKKNK